MKCSVVKECNVTELVDDVEIEGRDGGEYCGGKG